MPWTACASCAPTACTRVCCRCWTWCWNSPAANTSWNLHWNAPTPACAQDHQPQLPVRRAVVRNRSRCAGSSCAPGEHTSRPSQAADSVLDEQTEKLAIQRRFSSDMREIWFMQPRFERRMGKTIYRMIEQPRFRAACDFLQLRARRRRVRQRAGAMVDGPGQCRRRPARRNDREVSRLPRDPRCPASTSANRRRRPRRSPRGSASVSNERGSRARLYRARRQPGRQRATPDCARRPASPP